MPPKPRGGFHATVSAKLGASAAGAGLARALRSVGSLRTQQQQLSRADTNAQAADTLRSVAQLRAALARARRHDQEAIAATEHRDLAELRASDWQAAMADARASVAALRDGPAARMPSQDMQGAAEALDAYAAGFRETMAAVKNGLLADARSADGTLTDGRGQADLADDRLARLSKALLARADEARQAMAAAQHGARDLSLGLLGFSAVLGALAAVAMRRAILRPLSEAIGMARRVAAGDLAQQPPARRADEFGVLLESLDDMRGQLQRLVSEVRHSVDSVALSSAGIASGNEDLADRTALQAGSLCLAAESVRRMTESLVDGARGAGQVSAAAQAMVAGAREGGQRVQHVLGAMNGIHATAVRVRSVADIIDELARQTHILGLNAAVEASSAGDRGRGFGVIASSVRELAERCRNAAGEVRSLVEHAAEQVGDGIRQAAEADARMTSLVAEAQGLSSTVEAISRRAQRQRDEISGLGEAMGHIDGATQQNAALVQEAAASARALKEQAERLARSAAAFKLS